MTRQDAVEFQSIFGTSQPYYNVWTGSTWIRTHERYTVDTVIDHLNGSKHIGASPFTNGIFCKWSAIDLDIRDNDYTDKVIKKIMEDQLPLVPFWSKSSGLHIFIFYKTPVDAVTARNITRGYIQILGLAAKTEIFPKQEPKNEKEAETANILGFPLYNYQTKENRKHDLAIPNKYTFTELISYCIKQQKDVEEHTKVISKFSKQSINYSNFPPCLVSIHNNYLDKLVQGEGRNEYLFSMFYALRQSNSETAELELWNENSLLGEPLDVKEVETIIKSCKKKEYFYKCESGILADHCDKSVCATKQFGIKGGHCAPFKFGQLWVITGARPSYELEIVYGDPERGQKSAMFEFESTEALLNQKNFPEMFFEKFDTAIVALSKSKWTAKINEIMSEKKTKIGKTNVLTYTFDLENNLTSIITGEPGIVYTKVPANLDIMPYLDEDNNYVYVSVNWFNSYRDAQKIDYDVIKSVVVFFKGELCRIGNINCYKFEYKGEKKPYTTKLNTVQIEEKGKF